MSSTLSIIPPSPEGPGSEGRSFSQQPPRQQAATASGPEAPPQADPGQRLVIEETADGGLVYTVTDRASGAVVARTSRDEVTQMGQQPGYAAGALIRARA
ncbi:MAG: hypothetical protein WDN45_05740 [Caulobacteraceae bacterium]